MRQKRVTPKPVPSGSIHCIESSPEPDLDPACCVRLVLALGGPGGTQENKVNRGTPFTRIHNLFRRGNRILNDPKPVFVVDQLPTSRLVLLWQWSSFGHHPGPAQHQCLRWLARWSNPPPPRTCFRKCLWEIWREGDQKSRFTQKSSGFEPCVQADFNRPFFHFFYPLFLFYRPHTTSKRSPPASVRSVQAMHYAPYCLCTTCYKTVKC